MKLFITAILFNLLVIQANSQVLCIQCFNQNARVSSNVTDFVVNGSFESILCNGGFTNAICPNSSNYNCDLDNWLCTGGGTGTYAMSGGGGLACADGINSVYFGNYFCSACNAVTGDTTCLVNMGCTVTGIPPHYPASQGGFGDTTGVSLSQTVSGLTPGTGYVLEFWVGGEDNFPDDGMFAVDFGFGDTFLRNPSTSFGATGRRYIVQFLAIASTHTVKITNWGHICQTCTELILDDVRVYPISQLSSIIPACAVGITDENEKSGFEVRFTNNTIYINSNLLTYTYRLYSSSGQKINDQSMSGNVVLNMSILPRGVYFYELTNEKKVIKNKIVII